MRISLSGVTGDSIVDGPGLRLTIFTQGCLHHCPGCHNPGTHDPAGGREVSVAELAAEQAISAALATWAIFSRAFSVDSAALAAAVEEVPQQMQTHQDGVAIFTAMFGLALWKLVRA